MSFESNRSGSIDEQWIKENEAKEITWTVPEKKKEDTPKTKPFTIVDAVNSLVTYRLSKGEYFDEMLDFTISKLKRENTPHLREMLISMVDSKIAERESEKIYEQQKYEERKKKVELEREILQRMTDSGEFSHDYIEREWVKYELQFKSIEELKELLNSYSINDDQKESTDGFHI